jgi:hypothetical protein
MVHGISKYRVITAQVGEMNDKAWTPMVVSCWLVRGAGSVGTGAWVLVVGTECGIFMALRTHL